MFEDEKKFENTQGTETPAAGTTPTPETANPAAGQSAGACDPADPLNLEQSSSYGMTR